MKKDFLTFILCFVFVFEISAQTKKFDWGKSEYTGRPWIKNTSRPNTITDGLNDRHFSIWSSHGRYYDVNKGYWKWQRPNLFGTTEDLYTQTIVIPYLLPMLENAGAVVISPRERDWQKQEVIVDNDNPKITGIISYNEVNNRRFRICIPSRNIR